MMRMNQERDQGLEIPRLRENDPDREMMMMVMIKMNQERDQDQETPRLREKGQDQEIPRLRESDQDPEMTILTLQALMTMIFQVAGRDQGRETLLLRKKEELVQ